MSDYSSLFLMITCEMSQITAMQCVVVAFSFCHANFSVSVFSILLLPTGL